MEKHLKIYITGTNRGLGGETYKLLSSLGHDVIGLSRPEYDLSKNLDDFVKKDFDIYINNAYYEYTQTQLLYKLYEKNVNRSCAIINISGISPDRNFDHIRQEAAHKSSLDKAARQLQDLYNECKVILLKPGKIGSNNYHTGYDNITNKHLAQTINWLINTPSNVTIDMAVKFYFPTK
jgi:NADP-dependent 3-hydroxy acid dehydrogenase YdfG